MDLPKECRSLEALRALNEDFNFAFAILKHAVRKDLSSFTFSDLRPPAILQSRVPGAPVPHGDALATEVTIFEDHLHDRTTLLAQNVKMLREIWAFNVRTRGFRQWELKSPETARPAVDRIADLVSALNSKEESRVLAALDQWLERRVLLIEALQRSTSTEASNES
ncbi:MULTISPECIES: hypothetical protein [unclassified Sinorhizobium]|uniref:hypothetical protein n=1 Tax=unclassified Sinorhizobium TaxID=2613772 RepID=UPI003525837B